MAYEVKLPRLGWDMEEGGLAEWLKKDGEYVNAGEPLFSVEGDKAVQEIEALDSGILKIVPDGPEPGEKVAVGTLIAYLVPKEESASFSMPERVSEMSAGIQVGRKDESTGQVPASEPKVRPSTGSALSQRVYISPLAKRMAETLGLDWRAVKGTGMNGRISARDIERENAHKKVVQPVVTGTVGSARLPMSGIRKKIAEHMAYSAHTAAPVTLTTEVDATEMVKLRMDLKNDGETEKLAAPSYNDILARLCARALVEHPMLNARIEGDEIVQLPAVHIAIAVDTERGLLVPVLRDVQNKTLREIANESAILIEKTRSGSIGYEDLQGATFTITNLGMYDIDAFTPIIDLPQCAILGVGRIVAKQVVVDLEQEKVALRQCAFLSLTFDHRLIDGAQAARFLQRVKRFIERPYLWLAG